MAEKNWN